MDYSKLGLKVGLEIHQQLNTKHKLFCSCPVKKSETFPLEVRRKLRAVAGEMGEYDPAALYEFLRGRSFVYKANPESSCLVELDESPPLEINSEALMTTLQACRLLKCRLVDEVHVMRKTVIDGSSVSGFQRTSVIGYNGYIETSAGKIPVSTVCLEEDSAPALSKEKGVVEYRLDRLGTPLVEIATSSDIHSPQQAREAAENIGLLLRSLSVMRGIGSIRQDVNISISGGARVEIKGFQELEKIPMLVETEVGRQSSLLEIRDELQRRGLKELGTKPGDVTHVFRNTKCNFVKKEIDRKGKVFALVLPAFAGLLKKQCGYCSFGKELSGYAGAYGYGIMHSDEELEKYQLSEEFVALRKELGAKESDAVLIIAGESPENAANAVLRRAAQCLDGVPEETRVADNEGSKYTRPLPGSERMYPETDVPPVSISKELLKSLTVPKTLMEREKELKLPVDMARQLVRSPYFSLYEELCKEVKVEPVIIANMFLSYFRELSREGFGVEHLQKGDLLDMLKLVEAGKIDKKALYDSLAMLLKGKSVSEVEEKFSMMGEAELKKIIESVMKENPGKNESALMGTIMQRVKGKASGEHIMNMLKKLMDK